MSEFANSTNDSTAKTTISPRRREERKGFALVFLCALGVFAVQMGFFQWSHEYQQEIFVSFVHSFHS